MRGGRVVGRSGWGVRVDVECERRIEVFVKIKKKGGGVGSGAAGGQSWGGGSG